MNVLFVCHRLPFPPSRGGKIRPFNIIRHLNRQGHRVTVASVARSLDEAEAGRGLSEYCDEVLCEIIGEPLAVLKMLSKVPTMDPSSMGYFHSRALARRIQRSHQKNPFDFVFVHCSSVAPYVIDMNGMPKMFDLGDVDSEKWLIYSRVRKFPLSLVYWLEGMKLRRAEKRLAQQFDLCTCTTRAERATFDGFGTSVPSGWFPNGVDSEYFAPVDAPYDNDLISFVGRMDYFPNQQAMFWFCRDVWPLLRREYPDLRLQIVGANPSRDVKALADEPNVTVTGSVDDVRPYVTRSALTVAPLRIARGTQNKILESMAMGVPVVSSREASDGIDAVPDEHFLVADGATQFCERILRVVRDPQRRTDLAVAARQRVLRNHAWSGSMEKFDELVARCFASAGTAS